MEQIAIAMVVLGLLLLVFSGLWFLVTAFRESIWWGLACLFLPFVQLFFLIVHWPVAKKPFFFQLLGLALIILAAIVSPQIIHR